jgi:integrase
LSGKPFSLYKRPTKKGHVWYAQFKLPDGTYGTAKSTGITTKGRGGAEAWAVDYLRSGQVVTRENVTLERFAKGFFDHNGDYAKTKRMRGLQLSDRQLDNQAGYLENHLLPRLRNVKLSSLDYHTIATLQRKFLEDGLAGGTVNHISTALKIVLEEASKQHMIQQVPIIEPVAAHAEERGVLTLEEVKALFALKWTDARAYAGNLLAAATGLRAGEIVALQRRTYREDYIEVSYSWDSTYYRLKAPKTGRSRVVPVPASVRAVLDELLKSSPFKSPESFVFYSDRLDRPMLEKVLLAGLREALVRLSIGDQSEPADVRQVASCKSHELATFETSDDRQKLADEAAKAWAGRGIVFHSWRHLFNSILINRRIPIQKVQALTGHSTNAMTERYYHADDFKDVAAIQEDVFRTETKQ